MTPRPDPVLGPPPLRRSPLFWLGLFVAVFFGFEWWHSRQQYSAAYGIGSRDSTTTIYSAESALRLRSIAVNGNWLTWNRRGFFSHPASLHWKFRAVSPVAKDPGAFPGKAWERSGASVESYFDPDEGKEVYFPPWVYRYTEYRFDFVSSHYPTFSSPTDRYDRYDRLDIVAPYWFILSLYLPSWLGLMVWRRRRYFRRWDQVEGSVGILSGEPAGSASQASTS